MDTLAPPSVQPEPQPIAPVWHTVVLVSLLLGLSWLGAHLRSFSPLAVSPRPHGHIPGYVFVIVMEWLMVAFAWFGLRLKGLSFRTLLGSRTISFRTIFRDLGIAIVFLIGSDIILGVLIHILEAKRNQAMQNLVPQSRPETLLYLLVALSAGICEEIVCRGYLQKQLLGLFKSESAAILLQGIVFGAAHGYQGIRFMIIIGFYGCMFGALARGRNSLYPGMMTHALQDTLAGLLARHVPKPQTMLQFVRLLGRF